MRDNTGLGIDHDGDGVVEILDAGDGDTGPNNHQNAPVISLAEITPTAIPNSFTPNYYAYKVAFVNQDVNYAAALAFLLGFVIMIVSYVVQLSTQRRKFEQ